MCAHEREPENTLLATSSGWDALVAHGLIFLSCNLFPFAKVGVAGMSLVRRGAEPCPLERGDVSIKKAQKGEVSKNKTVHPLQTQPVPEAGKKVLGTVCTEHEL